MIALVLYEREYGEITGRLWFFCGADHRERYALETPREPGVSLHRATCLDAIEGTVCDVCEAVIQPGCLGGDLK